MEISQEVGWGWKVVLKYLRAIQALRSPRGRLCSSGLPAPAYLP